MLGICIGLNKAIKVESIRCASMFLLRNLDKLLPATQMVQGLSRGVFGVHAINRPPVSQQRICNDAPNILRFPHCRFKSLLWLLWVALKRAVDLEGEIYYL